MLFCVLWFEIDLIWSLEMYLCTFDVLSFLALVKPAAHKAWVTTLLWAKLPPDSWSQIHQSNINPAPSTIFYTINYKIQNIQCTRKLYIYIYLLVHICLCIRVDLVQYLVLCHIYCTICYSLFLYHVRWSFHQVVLYITFLNIFRKLWPTAFRSLISKVQLVNCKATFDNIQFNI